jgi:two-component system alkaline phosphatase synthesis response regulator PhoP
MSGEAMNELILLADDSTTMLTLVSARLQRTGYDVVTATRGDEALELALSRRPRLIVLDLEMPGLNGIEVSQRLRADPSFAETPIILLTSHTGESYVQAGIDAGANAYIVKPFSPQELASRVDELLGRG